MQAPANRSSPLDTWVGEAACSSGGSSSQWEGITCSEQGRVVGLKLSALGASGSLDALSPLTHLTNLQLPNNSFSGGALLLSRDFLCLPLLLPSKLHR